jgi:hypothetical protein
MDDMSEVALLISDNVYLPLALISFSISNFLVAEASLYLYGRA